ncbi:hypothetical protein FF38_09599 [Lucilia cuprina]|uniref:Uncharacterized protein n=1 Tax=Lucilia cuprina TaxID=7375 RepID=A0A0L0CI75_LUCCU|nr:hypothetical protein FF38_09599 [Lucilia cuprina]
MSCGIAEFVALLEHISLTRKLIYFCSKRGNVEEIGNLTAAKQRLSTAAKIIKTPIHNPKDNAVVFDEYLINVFQPNPTKNNIVLGELHVQLKTDTDLINSLPNNYGTDIQRTTDYLRRVKASPLTGTKHRLDKRVHNGRWKPIIVQGQYCAQLRSKSRTAGQP